MEIMCTACQLHVGRGDRPVARRKGHFRADKMINALSPFKVFFCQALGVLSFLNVAEPVGELPKVFQNLILRPGREQDR